jgi:hypothetical protein
MRRAVQVPPQDTTCNDVRPNYATMQAFTAFKEANGPNDVPTLLNRFRNITGNNLMEFFNSTDPNIKNNYFTSLGDLQIVENNLNKHIQCLNKDIIQRNDYTSKIYTLQQELESVRKEAQEKKQISKDAQERASQLENPYSKTTWWETWFPLGRPIQKDNVPVLLSVSIVMLVVSLGIFLRFAGLELRIDSIQTTTNSFLKNIQPRKYP